MNAHVFIVFCMYAYGFHCGRMYTCMCECVVVCMRICMCARLYVCVDACAPTAVFSVWVGGVHVCVCMHCCQNACMYG